MKANARSFHSTAPLAASRAARMGEHVQWGDAALNVRMRYAHVHYALTAERTSAGAGKKMGMLAELISSPGISREQRGALGRLEEVVRGRQMNEALGHDWWHTYRVVRMALRLGEEEGGDRVVIFLAALLHDIADHKFHGGDEEIGPRTADALMTEFDIDQSIRTHAASIIASLSFKGVGVPTPMPSIEGAIVQDADRLDAIGAIGVARAFAYGGMAGRVIHDPTAVAVMHTSAAEYKNARGTTINHFYEKLLVLGDRINTESARRVAAHRTAVIETFLAEFLLEWDGDDSTTSG